MKNITDLESEAARLHILLGGIFGNNFPSAAKSIDEKYDALDNRIKALRGIIIDSAVLIEALIEQIISNHFCYDQIKENEFTHIFMGKESVTLSFKREVLIYIIKNHHPAVFKKNPKLFDDLELIIKYRNMAAHRKFMPAREIVEQWESSPITLEHWVTKDSKINVKKFDFNSDVLLKFYECNRNCLTVLLKLSNGIRKENQSYNKFLKRAVKAYEKIKKPKKKSDRVLTTNRKSSSAKQN